MTDFRRSLPYYSMLAADDVDDVRVPVAMYLSQDEPIDDVSLNCPFALSRSSGPDPPDPTSFVLVPQASPEFGEQALCVQECLQGLSDREPRLRISQGQPSGSGRESSVRGRVWKTIVVLPDGIRYLNNADFNKEWMEAASCVTAVDVSANPPPSVTLTDCSPIGLSDSLKMNE